MRTLFTPLILIIASVSFAQPGSLKSSFGNGGKVITNMGISSDVLIYAMAIQIDGKILVAGNVLNGTNEDFALARYHPDGSLDNSFDGDGKVYTAVGPGSDIPYDITLQPDGKIVVVGRAHNGINSDIAVVRYNSDGTLDNTFDLDGKVMTNISMSTTSQHDIGRAVHITNDGKILVGGHCPMSGTANDFAVARYKTDGSLDSSSDGDGKLTTAFVGISNDMAFSMVVQSDGKFILGGRSYIGGVWSLALVRYNADGTLDNTFDEDGKVTTIFSGDENEVSSIALQSDNKIVAAGYTYNSTTTFHDFAIARFNTDGSLDGTFDGDGKVVTDHLGLSDIGRSVVVQNDGKILVGGFVGTGGNFDFAVFRYNTDGTLDNMFDGDGKATTPIGTTHEQGYDMALYENTIYLAGYTASGTNNDFALVAYQNDATLLPLSFTLFTVTKAAGSVRLQWKTAFEQPAAYFEVEHSTDGRNFTKIGNVPGMSSSGITNNVYTFTNHLATQPIAYYRLKAVDRNGKPTYSKTITVRMDEAGNALQVFPTPARNVIQVQTSLQGTLQLIIHDMTGKLVKHMKLSANGTTTTIPFDIADLRPGTYALTIKGADTAEKKIFIKE